VRLQKAQTPILPQRTENGVELTQKQKEAEPERAAGYHEVQ
jgi:hypothetical protein